MMQAILALSAMVGALIGVTAYLWTKVNALEKLMKEYQEL